MVKNKQGEGHAQKTRSLKGRNTKNMQTLNFHCINFSFISYTLQWLGVQHRWRFSLSQLITITTPTNTYSLNYSSPVSPFGHENRAAQY